jgi:hypothetical protein
VPTTFPTEEVSGDYYDWVKIHEDEFGFVIADVSGKGVPAAILMSFLRASLRAATHVGYATNISNGESELSAVGVDRAESICYRVPWNPGRFERTVVIFECGPQSTAAH